MRHPGLAALVASLLALVAGALAWSEPSSGPRPWSPHRSQREPAWRRLSSWAPLPTSLTAAPDAPPPAPAPAPAPAPSKELRKRPEDEDEDEEDEEDGDDHDLDDPEEEEESYEGHASTTQRSHKNPSGKRRRKTKKGSHTHIKLKGLKKLKKYLLPMLLAYKLKFALLIPFLLKGMFLLMGTTAFAGFFFILFAVGLGLKKD